LEKDGMMNRPLTSYGKVQRAISPVIRNRRFQLMSRRIHKLEYLQLGCGGNCPTTFINVDYQWHPSVDLCWDFRRGLPFRSASISGIFTEHCIEHLSLFESDFGLGGPCAKLIKECHRVMRPGAVIRIVVPDAQLYLETYFHRAHGDATKLFPYETAKPNWLPILHVNRIFYDGRPSPLGHCTMFDFDLISQLLKDCGFRNVKRQGFQSGDNPVLLIDTPEREPESLYVEATR
jgi:predicted SAM-dependent methyltransferase